MDLNKEISGFKDSFTQGGVLTRTLLIFGFIFTVSSITSIASKVVEWKGFILGALNFYQLYFVGSVSKAALFIGFQYSNTEIHVATISSTCVIVGMRLLASGQKIAFREINKEYNSELVPSMAIYWLLGFVIPIGIWVWYGASDPVIRPWYVIFVSVFYPVFIVAPKYIMSKFGWVNYERGYFSYAKSYYAYMVTIFIVVGTLAAVNSGLQENQPIKSMKPTANASAD
ncbi:hypothetical protein [Shewanella sp. SM96]|uniref:hypothetical protein n=1 Tax=Shewanella sp. SM96 TaxID=2912813 RepID=UPI0021D8FEEC|nr:hypothetical protein [Shewanella sp. SM96]MCU8003997.1 hypothetical protein [Shewanella sp. SM96]